MTHSSSRSDWPHDAVVTAIHDKGLSLVDLDRKLGLSAGAVHSAITKHSWPRVKRAIAEAIGEHPHSIWPSMFRPDGSVIRNRRGAPRHGSTQATAARAMPHVQKSKVS